MIVCSCRVISDREIRAAMADGARRCGDVFRRCGSGPQCGSCVPLIREMLAMMPGAAAVCAGAAPPAGAD
ncbi:bacterioferritin-associated ferredoxin [Stella sp.]|uniref:(2Fe-2S)-binding protein n=1 Tax=Stella sp. TaxID=2912054 RepID=UPI0035B2E65E